MIQNLYFLVDYPFKGGLFSASKKQPSNTQATTMQHYKKKKKFKFKLCVHVCVLNMSQNGTSKRDADIQEVTGGGIISVSENNPTRRMFYQTDSV